MNKEFRFISGIPRSGSTVLCTLLSQHPELYTSPTSPMSHLLEYTRGYGYDFTPYFPRNCERVLNIQRGIMDGFYHHAGEPFVLEKDRTWANRCSLLKLILEESPKTVATTRRVSEAIASFTLIADRNGPLNIVDTKVKSAGSQVNRWTRSKVIWELFIYPDWRNFKAGYESYRDCFLTVDYAEISSKPEETVTKIYNFFGMEPYGVLPTNLVNPSPEDDSVYGLQGLHDIRPTLKRTSPPPEEVLGEDVCAYWDDKNLEFWNK